MTSFQRWLIPFIRWFWKCFDNWQREGVGHVGGWDCGWGKLVVGWGVGWGLVWGGGGENQLFVCLCLFDFFAWKCVMIYCVWCSFCFLQGVKHQVTYSLWWPLWLLFKSVLLSFFIFFRARFLLSWCFCCLSLFVFFCIPGFGLIMSRCTVFRYGWTNEQMNVSGAN